jgi:hypothetical protein
MPNTLLDVDLKNARVPQIHNRWHPDIPAIASVDIGDTWRCESVDWTGGQIHDDESANDVRDVHYQQITGFNPINMDRTREIVNLGELDITNIVCRFIIMDLASSPVDRFTTPGISDIH